MAVSGMLTVSAYFFPPSLHRILLLGQAERGEGLHVFVFVLGAPQDCTEKNGDVSRKHPLLPSQGDALSLVAGTRPCPSPRAVSTCNGLVALLQNHALAGGDDADIDHVQEQTMIDDALKPDDGSRSSLGILDGILKVEVYNVVAVVRHIRLVSLHTQLGLAPCNFREVCNALQVVLPAELNDLHRHCQFAATKPINKLAVIDNADKLFGGHLYHLLTKQGSTAALHNIKVGVNLIRAIDGHIKLWLLIKCRKRDSTTLRLLVCSNRSWDRDNVLKLPTVQKIGEAVHCEGCCRAGTKTNNHSTLNVLHSLPCCFLLKFVLALCRHYNLTICFYTAASQARRPGSQSR
mmetsp:Transcript_910/g.2176  ORF Transcript_910/g.2176 Transcript_910/m.2176 type:complete len:348 (+) Transcript_910:90-1133(+)